MKLEVKGGSSIIYLRQASSFGIYWTKKINDIDGRPYEGYWIYLPKGIRFIEKKITLRIDIYVRSVTIV